MALISQRESNVNSISFYKISALRSAADLDRWVASALPADLTIRRVLLENSAGLHHPGDKTRNRRLTGTRIARKDHMFGDLIGLETFLFSDLIDLEQIL